jgi:hypothetical protein
MKKFFDYLWFLLKCKWHTAIECFKYGLFIEGILHNISQFLPDEFLPYMNYFYGTGEPTNKKKEAFDIAWLKSQERNPHHWQHWILVEPGGNWKAIGIPRKYIQEMVCDWVGAGKAIHGKDDVVEWHEANKSGIVMECHSKAYLEFLIENRRINNKKGE